MSAFRNSRFFLCRPDDTRLAAHAPCNGHTEQAFDGPTLVVIGREADDLVCGCVARALRLDEAAIVAFRDGNAVACEVRS